MGKVARKIQRVITGFIKCEYFHMFAEFTQTLRSSSDVRQQAVPHHRSHGPAGRAAREHSLGLTRRRAKKTAAAINSTRIGRKAGHAPAMGDRPKIDGVVTPVR